MSSLYEIRQDLLTVIEGGYVFDEETGEVFWSSDNLDRLAETYDAKVEACGCYIKNLQAEAEMLKAEEQALAKRRKAIEGKEKWMRDYLLANLQEFGEAGFSAKAKVSTRKSEAVQVLDVSAIPDEFMRVKTTATPDKTAIKKALKNGESVPGAAIVQNVNLVLK